MVDKIGTEIFVNCKNKIDKKVVNKYMKNVTFFYNFTWEKSFDEYSKIDFNKYKVESDLIYTEKQNILMNKNGRVNEIYTPKKVCEERQQMESENKKIKK